MLDLTGVEAIRVAGQPVTAVWYNGHTLWEAPTASISGTISSSMAGQGKNRIQLDWVLDLPPGAENVEIRTQFTGESWSDWQSATYLTSAISGANNTYNKAYTVNFEVRCVVDGVEITASASINSPANTPGTAQIS